MIWIKYLPTLAVVAEVGALVWYVMDLRHDKATLNAENEALTAQVVGCEARVEGNIKHREREIEIDNLSDTDLRERASDWLLP